MKLTTGNTRGRATGLDNVDGSFVNNPYCVSQAEYLTVKQGKCVWPGTKCRPKYRRLILNS
jgi:hypothetical protein